MTSTLLNFCPHLNVARAVPAQCRKGAKKNDDVPRDRTQICQNDKKGEEEVQVYNLTMRSPTFSR